MGSLAFTELPDPKVRAWGMLTDALRGTAIKITLSSQQYPVPSHLLKSYIFHSHVFEICDIALVFLNRKKNRLKVTYLIM